MRQETVELYVIAGCPHCDAARESLEWRRLAFVEYDVEQDPAARARLLELTHGHRLVPVVHEPGKPLEVGWQGRGCPI